MAYRITWLFNMSSALYPSGYFYFTNNTDNRNHMYGTVLEAFRVRDKVGSPYKPVYVYTKFALRQTDQSHYSKVSFLFYTDCSLS